jgi:uncharacterized protein YdhG (YjbR/CyaY superfamily)
MQSKARDVSTYLDGVKERDRDAEIAFASQANYISLYVLKTDVVKANSAALRGLSVGKGCIRFRSPEKVDFALVEKLLADSRRSSNRIC